MCCRLGAAFLFYEKEAREVPAFADEWEIIWKVMEDQVSAHAGKKRARTVVGIVDPHLAEGNLSDADIGSFSYVVSVEAADTAEFDACKPRARKFILNLSI